MIFPTKDFDGMRCRSVSEMHWSLLILSVSDCSYILVEFQYNGTSVLKILIIYLINLCKHKQLKVPINCNFLGIMMSKNFCFGMFRLFQYINKFCELDRTKTNHHRVFRSFYEIYRCWKNAVSSNNFNKRLNCNVCWLCK